MLVLSSFSMVRWRWLAAAVLGSAATLASCVIESGGPTATELYRLIDAHCERAAVCQCTWALADDACTPELEARWKERLSEAQRRELHYDAECFTTIISQIETHGCYWPGGEAPLCERYCAPFHGDRAEGESCEGDDALVSDCAAGLVCAQGTCTSPCAALGGRQQGETCSSELLGPYDDCAGGLFCSWSTGACEVAPTAGEACLDGSCGLDLYCDWNTNRCVTAAGPGEPCADVPCIDDHFCDWQSNRCVAAPGEGESCFEYSCADGLYCFWQEQDGTAVCRRLAGLGEGCSGNVPCADQLWCDELTNVCVTAPGEDAACLYGYLCAEGLVCGEVGTCVTPPGEGEPCILGSCDEDTWCDTSVVPTPLCAARRANDEVCSGHRQCESGYCPNGYCWPLPVAGESCEGTNACAGGLVCNGTTCEPTLTRAPAACSYPAW